MKNTIILPTDFSECSNNALDYAVFLAKELNLKISIVHAINFKELDDLERNSLTLVNKTKSLIRASEKKMKVLVNKVETHQIECTSTTFSGEISTWLPEFTSKNNPKLIIMGTAGTSSLAKKVIGSNTYSIIKKTNVPILSVPEKAKLGSFKKFAFLSDLKNNDTLLNDFFVDIATHFNSVIDIIHVLDNPSEKKEDTQKLLADLKIRAESTIEYKNLKHHLLFNLDIKKRLLNLINESTPDVIAFVMPRQHFFKRLFSVGHTEKIAYYSNTPLLVFPIKGSNSL